MNKVEKIFLVFAILIGLLISTYRLVGTQLLIQDTARDTLKILTLWQDKSITLIGPPASFSLNSTKEFYFGSFSYYFALIGLILTSFNPAGAALPTIVLFLISIPIFFLFLKNLKSSIFNCYVGTILYVVSPLTVTHMRFFWNPNTIIPLSVFYWYLATLNNKTKSFEIGFLAGLIMAIIFNFHYFMIIPMLVWGLINVIRKHWENVAGNALGFFIGTFPLLLFELKHEFYLFNSLIYNLNHKSGIGSVDIVTFVGRLSEVFMAVLGIKSGEISFSTFLNISGFGYWIVAALIFGRLLYMFIVSKFSSRWLLLPLFVTIAISAKLSDASFYSRYVFGAYPLVIWAIAEMLNHKYFRYLLLPIFLFIFYSNFRILTFSPSLATGYIPLKTVEKIANKIVSENPEGKYNLSENIFGDAQALGLRFFIQRDSKTKPQGIEGYGWLNTLYVVSPSLEKIKLDNRWEFYASAPWKEPTVENFGEVNLYKFVK